MAQLISGVDSRSPAWLHSIHKGDKLIRINGEEVLDQIDYQALTTASRLSLEIERPGGQLETISFKKGMYTPLGLHFSDDFALKPRVCQNNCVFCFVAEMAPGLRPSLYVKDDDWRMSLMMGNFITLTNINEEEMGRIIRRHASPLYISVHATDPGVRCRMMRNPHAGDILARLKQLADNDIHFHCQVVLCPGWNDGNVLRKTLDDLYALRPCAESVALVPVGLTRFRNGLEPLVPFDAQSSARVLEIAEPFRERAFAECRTRFVFPADEFYCLTGREMPAYAEYEAFAQIENGIGMMAQLREQMRQAAAECAGMKPTDKKVIFVSGTSAAPYSRRYLAEYGPMGADYQVIPIINHYFGELITVAGLLTATDIIAQLKGIKADIIYLPATMLRPEDGMLLDGKTIYDIEQALGIPVRPLADGRASVMALYETEEL